MHYNSFTINYIRILKKYLKIEINGQGKAIYDTSTVNINDISLLIESLKEIWKDSKTTIEILKNKTDSKIQAGLFGLHEDLEFAIKTGFLISDRIVLIDYLFDRVLSKKDINKINISQVMEISITLVKLLPLAEKGRIVIIPNPFNWNQKSKDLIKEVSEKTTLSISLIGMLNILSICKMCNLHPYTIANSEEQYNRILSTEVDHVDMIGKDRGKYAYEGILGALMSQKLLTETSFSCSKSIPIEKYIEIISKHEKFYEEYLTLITNSGSMNANLIIDRIQYGIDESIKNGNLSIRKILKRFSKISDIGGSGIALAALISPAIPASIGIIGGILSLSGQLSSLIKDKKGNESTIISLFKDFEKESKKSEI
jgi:hypothetical protein